MRDSLWVNPDGTVKVVSVDDNGEPIPDETAPVDAAKFDADHDGKPGGSPKGSQSTAHKGALKRHKR